MPLTAPMAPTPLLAAVPPSNDSNAAPAAVTTVFRGNLSFRLDFGCEYATPIAIKFSG